MPSAGHYARLRFEAPPNGGAGTGAVHLLRGADPAKDQSYFLATVQQHTLRPYLFPVGERTPSCFNVLCLVCFI